MRLSIFSILVLCTAPAFAAQDHLPSIKDSLVLEDVPEAVRIDSAIQCYYEELAAMYADDLVLEDLYHDSAGLHDISLMAARLQALDERTPFDLSYNASVEAFIHLYITKKRSLSARCLGKSELYFPLFEETLDKHNLPLELKYLAVVESGLNPTIKSRAGATGLWQFMYWTGKKFGLRVDSYVDERCDPVKSTEAACNYLSYLYRLFDDWNLALAAYNCGEGRVARAIRRAGGEKDYWAIYPYLPRETRGYVPAFIAVNYLFAYHDQHQITAEPYDFKYNEVDSVHVKRPTSFQHVSQLLGLPEEDVAALNPVYRRSVVPAYDDLVVLNLPREKVNLWVANSAKIDSVLASEAIQKEVENIPPPQELQYYTVRSGDYLGKIANQHRCTVRQLQEWNNMSSTSLRVGQKLIVYSNGSPSTTKSQPKPQIDTSGKTTYYTIRSGDTLWDIAKAQGVSLNDLKRWNTHVNFNNMKPGQKIIIAKQS